MVDDRVYWAEPSEIAEIARALDSELRRRIIALIATRSLNVNQIAQALGIPQSTCVVNVQILASAGIVYVEHVVASRGAQKLCSLRWDGVMLPLREPSALRDEHAVVVDMPVGLYTDHHAAASCGMVNSQGIIGFFDHPETFLNPKRATAGLIWLNSGFLEYRFPKASVPTERISAMSVTVEVCSEFPGFNNNWPSDITVWLNGREVGTWTCPGDMGGEYGRFTPRWWDLVNTQYGFLKTWKVRQEGSFIDGERVGGPSLDDLDLGGCHHYMVRIGVKDDAENRGGFNLFGRTFGNYEQDVVLRVELKD
jgi:predicted transcriptional regulator